MTVDEQTELIEKAIDRFTKAMADIVEVFPRYLFFEMAHPKKKPRGSIRRRRRRKNENTAA
jgi:hypothetical protein